jgi:hypothetical protein
VHGLSKGPDVTRVVTRDVLLTPGLARRWLANSVYAPGGRELNDELVRVYGDAMTADQWRAGSIVVHTAPGGRLHDGGHRAAAVVASGVCVWVRSLTVHTADAGEPADPPGPVSDDDDRFASWRVPTSRPTLPWQLAQPDWLTRG